MKLIRKDPVPPQIERPVMGQRSDKNFVRENAIENIHTRPPQHKGDQFWFTSKPNYGKIPRYLERTKRQLAKEKADMDNYLHTQACT
jgi:hypothetical protein